MRRRGAAIVLAGLTVATVTGAGTLGTEAPTAQGPRVQLIAAQNNITLPQVSGSVYLDPGI